MAVSKAPVGMNNATVVSGAGFRAAIEGLTPEEHLRDTIEVGKGLNDRRLVEIFAREGGERVAELGRFGVEAITHPGGAHVKGLPSLQGYGITKPMADYAKSRGIIFHENVIVTKLLKEDGAVVGAVGYDERNDRPIIFSAKATVLASGGAGALYRRTDCPLRTTGDGYSLAYHTGAKLRDMEFVQFFPLALAEPGFPPYLVGGPIPEEGRIINSLGEDIPRKHNVTARPLVLKSRDLLSRAVMTEIRRGMGVDGAVLIDATEVFRNRKDKGWFSTGPYELFRDKLRAEERPFKVAPICHFCMGGVVIDEHGRTGVSGLFAAGEVVGGVHGANRHGGNALTDIMVFGARAGAAAAEVSRKAKATRVAKLARQEIGRYEEIASRENGYNPYVIMSRLREAMWAKAGIIRDSSSLAEAFEEIIELKGMADRVVAAKGRDMLVALEAPMALDAAEMIVRAAMERRESRGAHYRKDFPAEDPTWLKPVVVSKAENGAMRLTAGG